MTQKYRRDIDGLRAIAVLLVIGFHAFPTALPGGYVGVDVFFVISGFLITGLLLQDLHGKKLSFSGFYSRRIRRIFPALITVLLASFAAGWFLLLPGQLTSLGLNIFGGAAFSSNLVLFGQTGYFDLAAAQKPLLHLWSLGVEEQFYIVWPMLLMLAFPRRRGVVILAIGLLVASFAWNVTSAGTPVDFYLPFTRAWELMIGCVLAVSAAQGNKPSVSAAQGELLAFLGLGLIALPVVLLNRNSAFPGWWALLPTVGTALLLMTEGSWLNRVTLSHPIAVGIGLISYPLYLWHWPLLSFATIIEPTGPSPLIRAAAMLAAATLASVTYWWIERPIRTGGYRGFKVAGLCATMTLIGALGLGAYTAHGFPMRMPAALRNLTVFPVNEIAEWRRGTCFHDSPEELAESQWSLANCVEHKRPLLFLWGDSFSAAFYPGLKRLQQSTSFGIAEYSTAGCPSLLNFTVHVRPHCVKDEAFGFSILAKVHPDILLLFSSWTGYPEKLDIVYDHLTALIAKLRTLNIPHIIVMGPPPGWTGGLAKAAYDYYLAHPPLQRMIPTFSDFRLQNANHVQFRARVTHMGVEYISTWDVLCKKGKCRTWVDTPGGHLTSFDGAHLSVAGAEFVANAIKSCLFPTSALLPAYCIPATPVR